MENKARSGGNAGAAEGKGFYIVLFLCAAVVIASAWMLIAGVGTNVEDSETVSLDVSDAVVTMLPAGTKTAPDEDVPVSAMTEEEPVAEAETEESAAEESAEERSDAPVSYVWPVQGEIEVPYAVETLRYDATMADWRTHDGVDIACPVGSEVIAAANGTVASVSQDDLYGTVIELDHGNGVRSRYANLASEPPVWEGQSVSMGQTIGSVGSTALAETNVVPHLHFAMSVDGVSTDPTSILPALALGE